MKSKNKYFVKKKKECFSAYCYTEKKYVWNENKQKWKKKKILWIIKSVTLKFEIFKIVYLVYLSYFPFRYSEWVRLDVDCTATGIQLNHFTAKKANLYVKQYQRIYTQYNV